MLPSIVGKYDSIDTNDKNFDRALSNLNDVKIIRPKPGFLYLFDTIEIPISSSSPIIIGDITCVAEQVPIYPYTVQWEFIDWRYGSYKYASDNVSAPFWRYTYSNFNFGELQITASFEITGGTVKSTDSIVVKKFL